MKEPFEISRVSPLTGKLNTLSLTFDMEDYRQWQKGTVIQKAMPYLTADEREFLMTGYTTDDWKQMFGDKND
jgi:hypothetical protein